MANQVDFKILPSDQFNVYSPQTRSEKIITYFTLLSKLRGDILTISSQDDPNNIISAYYSNVGGTQTLHLVKADGSEVTASYSTATSTENQNASTGILVGGELTSSIGGTTFSVSSGVGQIVSQVATPSGVSTIITPISWDAFTSITPTNLTTQPFTYIYIDSSGVLQQQATPFNDTQYKNSIIIGHVCHIDLATINLVTSDQNVAYGTPTRLLELIQTFGPIKKEGLTLSANGSNLRVNRSAGEGFIIGSNYQTDQFDPDKIVISAKTPSLLCRIYRNGSGGYVFDNNSGSYYANVDPTKYDNGSGTLQTVNNNQWTIQRLYTFPSAPDDIICYYGVQIYNSQGDAIDNIPYEPFSEAPITALNSIFLGYLVVRGGASNLSSLGDATFIQAGLFRGLGSGGGSTTNLTLEDLSDVVITSPQNQDFLFYNSLSQEWQNVAVGAFKTIAVSGQSDIVADNYTDSLTVASGTGISLTTNASTDTLTITNSAPDQTVVLTAGTGITVSGTYPSFTITNSSPSSGGTVTSIATTAPITGGTITTTGTIGITQATTSTDGYLSSTDWNTFNNKASDAFKTIAVAGQSSVVADSATDTLTFEAGSNIIITTDAATDKITITAVGGGSGSVTSVDMSVPTGFAISGNPITTSGTLALAFASGYSLPTNASQANWNTAYNDSITAFSYNTSTGVLTLTQQDAGTLTATVTLQPFTTDNLTQGSTNLYDKVVSLTGAGTTVVTGTYPNFTITSNDQHVGTVTSVATTAPITGGTITSTGTIGITQSGTASDGYLSSTDWNTFNAKVAGSGTTNYVSKWTSSSGIGNSQIFDSGTYVGINTATPAAKLDISGAHVASIGLLRLNASAANIAAQTYYIDGAYKAATYAGTDDNFYILGRDADIVFSTTPSFTARMTISNGGNVGIGTSSPSQKLMVSGSIRVTGGYYDSSNSVGSNGQVLASTGTGTTWINASGGTVNGSGTVNYLSKWTGTTLLGDSQLFDNGTNVGIGTGTPNRKLTVSGDGTLLGLQSNTAGGYSEIELTANGVGAAYIFKASSGFSSYAGAGSLNIYNSGAIGFHTASVSNAMFIASSAGNIGLGNTLPSQKLHVDGNIRVTGAYYDSANSAGTSGQILSSTSTGTAWINQATGTVTGTGTTNYVSKWTSGTAIGNSSIFDNGNVGISTATPAQKLHVVGGTLLQKGITGVPSWANNTLELNSTGSDSISLEFHRPAYSSTQIWSNGNNLIFGTSSGTERMRIQDGFVGIGTTSPGTALDVNGSIRVTGRTTPSSGNGLEIFYYSPSDCFYLEAYNYTTSAYKTIRYAGASHEFVAGNVGIGLTAPSYKLDVSAAARIYGVRIGRDFSIADRATVRLDSNGNAPADILFGQTAAANQSGWDGVYWSISSRSSGTGAAEGNKFTIWRGSAHSAPYNSESQFVTITPDLNLGIGETSPTQKLHVTGNVRVSGAYYDSANAAGTSGQILSSTGTGTAWISPGGGGGIITGSGTTNYVTKWTGTSSVGDSSIFDNGNVGIGTTAPTAKLHVVGSATNGVPFINFETTSANGTFNWVSTAFASNLASGNNLIHFIGQSGSVKNSAYLGFKYSNSGSNDNILTLGLYGVDNVLNINGSGNVGIGTTSPDALLNVGGGDGTPTATQFTAVVRGTSTRTMYFDGGGSSGASVWWGDGNTPQFAIDSVSGGGAAMWVHASSAWYRIIDVAANGNVGINQTAPRQKLDVFGNISLGSWTKPGSTYVGLRRDDDGSFGGVGDSGLVIESYNHAAPYNGDYSQRVHLRTHLYNGGSHNVLTAYGFNVGIGTTAPGAKLEVNGNIKLSSTAGATATPSFIWLGNDYSNGTTRDKLKIYLYNSGTEQYGFSIGSIGDVQYHSNTIHDFYIANGNALRINSSGNVGIGTTAPVTNLHVSTTTSNDSVGNIQYENANTGTGAATNAQLIGKSKYGTLQYMVWESNGGRIGMRSTANGGAGNLYFTVGTDSVSTTMLANGNVGINETAPSQKLHVSGNIRVTGAYYDSANSAGTSGQILSSTATGTAWIAAPSGGITGSGTTNYVPKWTSGSAIGNSAIYDNAGNIGIGTTAPNGRLQINQGTDLNVAINTVTNDATTVSRISSLNDAASASTPLVINANRLVFTTDTVEQMRITSGGQLLLGETSAVYSSQFTVSYNPSSNNGPIILDNRSIFSSGVGGYQWFGGRFNSSNNYRPFGGIGASKDNSTDGNSAGYVSIFTNSNAADPTEKVRITSGGNVGINTTAPQALLHVSGTVSYGGARFSPTSADGESAIAFYADVAGTSTSTSWVVGQAGWGHTGDFVIGNENGGAGGNVRLLIERSGNVGIGTTSPVDKLDVIGILRVVMPSDPTTGAVTAKILSYSPSPFGLVFRGYETGAHSIQSQREANDAQLYALSLQPLGGNVGIGTTSPSTKLEVGNFLDAVTNKITVAARYEYEPEFNFRLGQSGTGLDWIGAVISSGDDGNYNGKILFKTANAGRDTPTTKMVIKANGNVGIGTTVPDSALEINGRVSIRGANELYFGQSTSTIGSWTTRMYASGSTHKFNANEFIFNNEGYGSTEFMRITSGGNVGIGTTSPSFKTTISADITKSGDINPGTAQLSLEGATTPGKRMILGYDTNSNGFGFIKAGNFGVTWTPLSLQPDGGNVGIGTTSPGYKLDVSGTIRATGDVIAYSDARVKENVETLDGALDKVMKMRGVSYNKIGEQEKKVGVIAQEILEVLPEVVSQDETGTYSVAYGNIVSVLIEAIKEQQKQIDELKSKLK